jgi:lambda family phage minor tail protein L
MSKFSEEIQSLSPTALIELFVLDMSVTDSGGILYFHAGTNELKQPVVWQGQIYQPWPIQCEGFDMSTQGALPRPKITVANTNGLFSGEVAANDDLLGCMIIRKRTFAKFLDAVNFPGGVNPDADPTQHADDDSWFVDQKTSENRYALEFELASVFDLMGIQLPYRQVLKSACAWRYRSAECGYTGQSFDRYDQPGTPLTDSCAKRLSSCKVRFGANPLPFGGFPGATRYEN